MADKVRFIQGKNVNTKLSNYDSKCIIMDVSAGGIYLGDGTEDGNLIANNYIHPQSVSGTTLADTSIKSSTETTLSHGGTFTVATGIYRDASGHISKIETEKFKLPNDNNTDTKVSTSVSTDKLFLIGKTDASKSTSSAANYNENVYIDGSILYSNGRKVAVGEFSSGKILYSQETNVIGEYAAIPGSANLYLNGNGGWSAPTATIEAASNDKIGGFCTGFSETADSKDYAVNLGRSNRAYVTVPWTDINVKDSSTSEKVFILGHKTQGSTAEANTNVNCYMQNGYIYAGAFYETSDERLKTFKNDIDVNFDNLSKCKKSYFNFNDSCVNHIGVSAQEIQKIYPEIVSDNGEGYLTVDYSKLSVIALAAIDKLHDRITYLENEISILKNN